jgi:drug/metabolite transporter (DMT)-like permease
MAQAVTQMSATSRTIPPWMSYAVLTVFLWGLWAFVSKLAGDSLTAAQSQVISTIGFLPIVLVLGRRGVLGPDRRWRGPAIAFAGGLIGGIGNVVFYWVLTLGGEASTVIPLTALYPMVTIVLALIFLRERINGFQWAGIVLALAAIYYFNVGREEGFFSRSLIYVLMPIFLWGLAGLLQKLCTNSLSGELCTFWFLTAFVVISLVLLISQPMNWNLSVRIWALAIAIGLFLGLGNLTVILAFARNGKASIITPLAGLYPFVSVPLAILLLDEKISPREALGLALAFPAIILLSREKP